ncbi:zf-HC2 domain-containing protein [Promicromonospora sukumoe]|uniref:zf-HC2 domain-containing protein n=1 Tax=Promicromonospora sukumoe TaxID=88382 RepID=UPI0037C5C479
MSGTGTGGTGTGGTGIGGTGTGGTGRCAELRDALTEVALGVADGPTRGAVMEHLATCDRCRDELSSLAAAADELLLLVPEREPPADFEGRVLARLGASEGMRERGDERGEKRGDERGDKAGTGDWTGRPGAGTRPARSRQHSDTQHSDAPGPATVRRHRAPRAVVAAALGVGLLAAGGASVWVVTAPDRELASSYRATLDTAGGRYLAAADLVTSAPADGSTNGSADGSADGSAGGSVEGATNGTTGDAATSVGTAFLYEGNPSWAYVVVRDAGTAARYDVTVVAAGDADGTNTVAPYGRGVRATEPGHTNFDRRTTDTGTPPDREIALGSCVVTTGTCTAGGVLGVPVRDVLSIRLTTPDGTTWATATLP